MVNHYALCRSVGSGIPFVLGDGVDAVTVLLQPMRLKDWGVLENILLLERKKQVASAITAPEQFEVLKEAIREDRSINVAELFRFADTEVGATWRLWLSLREQQPYWQCVQWVDTLVASKRLTEYLMAANQIDGIDVFATLDWPVLPFQEELALLKGKKEQEKSDKVDWKLHIAGVADVFHIPPTDFGELTFYQARILLWDREALAGKIKLTPEEYKNVSWIRKSRRLYAEQQAALKNAALPSEESNTDSPPLGP